MRYIVSAFLMHVWILAAILQCKGSPSQNSQRTVIGLCPCNQTDASLIVYLETPPMAEIFRKAQELSRELTIDRGRVSAKHRQKTSAADDRLSSRSMGAVGGVVILCVVGLIITLDIITMKSKRSRKQNKSKSKKRKSSNTSSSNSVGTISTSVSASASTHHRRVSSSSATIANSLQIGIFESCLNNDNSNLLNYLPTISTLENPKCSAHSNSNKTTTRSKSFTSLNNNILVCYQMAAPTQHLRSHSFSGPGQMADPFGLSAKAPTETKSLDPVPDIVVT